MRTETTTMPVPDTRLTRVPPTGRLREGRPAEHLPDNGNQSPGEQHHDDGAGRAQPRLESEFARNVVIAGVPERPPSCGTQLLMTEHADLATALLGEAARIADRIDGHR